MADSNGFTLGEASRQIDAIWETLRGVKEEVNKIGPIGTQVSMILDLLTNRGLPKCSSNDTRLDHLEKRVDDLEKSNVTLKADTQELKTTSKILKWVTGLVSTGAAGLGLGDIFLKG